MRIIAGKFKGRVIEMPKGIRPTSDKVREALFEILKARLQGASFLDLYCGSGAVGIEAFSRGAKSVTFVDNDVRCIRVLKKNLTQLSIEQCDIYKYDVQRFLNTIGNYNSSFGCSLPASHLGRLAKRYSLFVAPVMSHPQDKILPYNLRSLRSVSCGKILFDIVFLDPPYYNGIARNTLIELSNCDILTRNTVIVAELYKKEVMSEQVGQLKLTRIVQYGDTKLEFFRGRGHFPCNAE